MPGARLPDDPNTTAPADWYSAGGARDLQALVEEPLGLADHEIGKKTMHFLVSHPTPPVFDGPEDRNGTPELRRDPPLGRLHHARRRAGTSTTTAGAAGLKPGLLFVIAGDQNSDPLDGDSIPGRSSSSIEHPLVNTKLTPSSPGAVEQAALQGGANAMHRGDPAFDTAGLLDVPAPATCGPTTSCRGRTSRAGRCRRLRALSTDPLFALVGVFPFPSSDHRLVWIDVDPPSS